MSFGRYELEKYARCYFENPSSFPERGVYLASFPKSGNSWFRFVVSNVNSIIAGDSDASFHTISNYAPAVRGNRKLSSLVSVDGTPVFLKTHFPFNPFFKGAPAVVVVRDPFYVIPSYYEYLCNAKGKKLSSIEDFFWHWRYGFNAWGKFMSSWRDSENAIFVRYEDLLGDPILAFSQLYKRLGYEISKDVISAAVDKSSRDRMRKSLAEKGDPHNINGFQFVKKSGENQGVSNLKNEILGDLRCSHEFLSSLEAHHYV
jgi:hypothetical protein